jgi:hypothetical protein
MRSIKQIIDDMGNSALESRIPLAGFAVLSDSGKIIFQTKNWDLSNQTDILMKVLKGAKSFVLNNFEFSVVQATPEGIVGTSAGGMGHVILNPFKGGTLVSYALPQANLTRTLDFLKGFMTQLNGLV